MARSYFKCYVDDLGFPTYLAADRVNPRDVAIYFQRKHKQDFIDSVNERLFARLSADFRSNAGNPWRLWAGFDGFGLDGNTNYCGIEVDAWGLLTLGFDDGPYHEHPLD